MMRIFLALAALAALASCKSEAPDYDTPWYQSPDATYDDLKRASDACKASGGQYQLKPAGDPRHLDDYACVKGKP